MSMRRTKIIFQFLCRWNCCYLVCRLPSTFHGIDYVNFPLSLVVSLIRTPEQISNHNERFILRAKKGSVNYSEFNEETVSNLLLKYVVHISRRGRVCRQLSIDRNKVSFDLISGHQQNLYATGTLTIKYTRLWFDVL